MPARLSHRAIAFFAIVLILFGLTFADAAYLRASRAVSLTESGALAARLGLTDLSLFTEARYTRHPSQADLHSAFQDHPLAFEHFPSGALIPPPRMLTKEYEDLDRKTKSAD
jgi:hypothetical protein